MDIYRSVLFKIGWLARLKGYKVSLEKLFQHICLTNSNKSYATGGITKYQG